MDDETYRMIVGLAPGLLGDLQARRLADAPRYRSHANSLYMVESCSAPGGRGQTRHQDDLNEIGPKIRNGTQHT